MSRFEWVASDIEAANIDPGEPTPFAEPLAFMAAGQPRDRMGKWTKGSVTAESMQEWINDSDYWRSINPPGSPGYVAFVDEVSENELDYDELYRGTNMPPAAIATLEKSIGKEVDWSGTRFELAATSSHIGVASDYLGYSDTPGARDVLIRIQPAPGQKLRGMEISGDGRSRGEEIITGGRNKFKVKEFERDEDGVYLATLEQVVG